MGCFSCFFLNYSTECLEDLFSSVNFLKGDSVTAVLRAVGGMELQYTTYKHVCTHASSQVCSLYRYQMQLCNYFMSSVCPLDILLPLFGQVIPSVLWEGGGGKKTYWAQLDSAPRAMMQTAKVAPRFCCAQCSLVRLGKYRPPSHHLY